MMKDRTITREAIEDDLTENLPGCDTVTALLAYDMISLHVGHDLADVINLGLAVLAKPRPTEGLSPLTPGPNVYAEGRRAGMDDVVADIFARAGVERPSS